MREVQNGPVSCFSFCLSLVDMHSAGGSRACPTCFAALPHQMRWDLLACRLEGGGGWVYSSLLRGLIVLGVFFPTQRFDLSAGQERGLFLAMNNLRYSTVAHPSQLIALTADTVSNSSLCEVC